ncbi:MAG: CBS domain-containing protein [Oscillospiraceae bacterium]|nr:CBS domain-containing protein [Oscillospiraceae bacterium]
MKVRDCMTDTAVSVAAEESAAVAARVMARHNVGSLPVRGRGGKLVGIVTDRDLALRVIASGEDAATLSVGSAMTSHVASVSPDDELSDAAALMAREQVRRLPVVENGRLRGMLSLADLTRSGYATEAAQALCEISSNVKKR